MLNTKFDFSLKVVVVGDTNVGKTSFLVRYVKNSFSEEYHQTIGVDFLTQTIQTQHFKIQLQLWDTAGQEVFRSLVSGYTRDCQCCFFIFDLTNAESFKSIDQWLERVNDVAQPSYVKCLIGNKCDLEDRFISEQQVKEFANEKNMLYFETSAKTGQNINKAFEACIDILKENANRGDYNVNNNNITLSGTTRRNCC